MNGLPTQFEGTYKMRVFRPASIRRRMFGLRRIHPRYFVILAILVAIDLIAKSQIDRLLVHVGTSMPLVPGFNLTLGHNRGVSFGVLDSDQWFAPYLLSILAVVLVVAVLTWTLQQRSRLADMAGILFASGGLANAIDRLGDGAVTDYLDFGWQALRWPTFNMADVFIILGVFLLLLGLRKRSKSDR